MRRSLFAFFMFLACAAVEANDLPRKVKIGAAIVEPRFAANEAVFDLLLQGFFPVDVQYSTWRTARIDPRAALAKRICPQFQTKFPAIECSMLDVQPAPESTSARKDYLRSPGIPAATVERTLQAARQQALDGLLLVSAGEQSRPSPYGYFSVMVRGQFPVQYEVETRLILSVRTDLYRVKDGRRITMTSSHGGSSIFTLAAPGAGTPAEALEGQDGPLIARQLEALWDQAVDFNVRSTDMSLYSRFKEKDPWAHFLEQ